MVEQDVMTGTRFVVALIFVLVALVLAVANRGKVKSEVYNRSRLLIILGNLLIVAHMIIQFLGHFRETSISTCWAINITFFVLLMPLYYMASINILCAGHNLRNRYLRIGLFYLVCYGVLGVGYATHHLINDQHPWMTATAITALLLFVFNGEMTYTIMRDMRKAHSALCGEEMEERNNALRYLTRSIHAVLVFSLFLPWWSMISYLPIVSLLTLCLFFSLLWYDAEFYFYGRDQLMVLEVSDEIYEASASTIQHDAEAPKPQNHADTEEEARIEQWIATSGFADPSITIETALRQMGVSMAALNLYLEKHSQVGGFRKWLTYLRVEEAKRLINKYPDYSMEAIAEACGYANNQSLTRAFKSLEGIPPKDWATLNRTR